MRWLLPFAVVMIGCVASIPSDPTISADLACETARAIVQLRNMAPPDDAPKPGDKCSVCNGTGKLPTDGRVVVECNACRGTGKTMVSVCVEGCE
jgi:hypothetical protein